MTPVTERATTMQLKTGKQTARTASESGEDHGVSVLKQGRGLGEQD